MTQNVKLVITTGHYPRKDVGAVGYAVESTVNRELLANMKLIANKYFKVPSNLIVFWNDDYTGNGTVGQNLYNTVQQCNRYPNAKLAVNLHLNSFGKDSANGVENFVSKFSMKKNELKAMSDKIIVELVQLGYTNRKTKETSTLYFNMNTVAPSILTETFFVSNKRDVEIYYANKLKIAYIHLVKFMEYSGLGFYVKPYKDTMLNTTVSNTTNSTHDKSILGYRLFTGTYANKVTAVNQGKQINYSKGWNIYVEEVNGKYRIKTGLFKTMEDAENGAKYLIENKISSVYHIETERPHNVKVEKPINANTNKEDKLHYIKFGEGQTEQQVKTSAENVRKSTRWIVHSLQHKDGKWYNKTGTFKNKETAELGLQTLKERKLVTEGIVLENN